MKKFLTFFVLICILGAFVGGYFVGVTYPIDITGKIAAVSKKLPDKNGDDEKNAADAEEKIEEVKDTVVDDMIATMTLDEMVYQMLFTTPEAITGIGTAIAAGETTKNALAQYPVGGLIYFSQNFESREQTIEMLKNTQSYSKIPLFLGVDEEGGRVMRLGSNPAMGVNAQPAMGTVNDAETAKNIGKTLSYDLSQLGINVDFAPVADVIVEGGNTEIGDRSFGDNPQTVATMVENMVLGLQGGGTSAALKHFPGHGSTINNSHTGTSESDRTIEELRTCEFVPFAAGISAGADFVMISHMTLMAATGEKVPASLSKEVVSDMLRGELGFSGVVITDAFNMGAVTTLYSQGEAAKKAVLAGVDMILMPQSISEVHSAIISAVQNGEITEERIKESVKRILTIKHEKGLF